MKILNAYAGIGGNRRKWPDGVEVVAVENDPLVAAIYSDLYPNDDVICEDAHRHIEKYYKDYGGLFSSPPCPSHSYARWGGVSKGQCEAIYPDFRLYEEIVFLQKNFKGKPWVVENVRPYYQELIPSKKIGRHNFWCNFHLPVLGFETVSICDSGIGDLQKFHGVDLSGYNFKGNSGTNKKRQILRNCIDSELGAHVFRSAFDRSGILL